MIRRNTQPTQRQLRSFALLWWPLFCVVVGLTFWRFGVHAGALAVAVLGGLTSIVGGLAPAAIRPVFVALLFVTYPIGWVLSHVVLLLAYYAVLTPVSLALRLAGRDPLFPHGRSLDNEKAMAQTRWKKWQAPESRKRYFSQY